jgi:hypothetical protein
VRWHYRDPALLWLLPAAFVLHILEEWFGGFPEWIGRIAGAPLPRAMFVVVNAIAMLAAVLAVRAAARREADGWVGIAVAAVFFVNAFAHVFGTVITRAYSPGLVTGLVLYLPIGGLVLLRAATQPPRGAIARGVATGVALNAAVFALAYALTRLSG